MATYFKELEIGENFRRPGDENKVNICTFKKVDENQAKVVISADIDTSEPEPEPVGAIVPFGEWDEVIPNRSG